MLRSMEIELIGGKNYITYFATFGCEKNVYFFINVCLYTILAQLSGAQHASFLININCMSS